MNVLSHVLCRCSCSRRYSGCHIAKLRSHRIAVVARHVRANNEVVEHCWPRNSMRARRNTRLFQSSRHLSGSSECRYRCIPCQAGAGNSSVFDAGSGVMMGAEGAVLPVADVLKKGGFTFDKSKYLSGIVSYYSKPTARCCRSPITHLRRFSITTRTPSRRLPEPR